MLQNWCIEDVNADGLYMWKAGELNFVNQTVCFSSTLWVFSFSPFNSQMHPFNVLRSLQEASLDSLFEVMLMLRPHECTVLAQLNHTFLALARRDALWRMYCRRIPHFQTHPAELVSIKELVRCGSFRLFYKLFRKLAFPWMGQYRLVPTQFGTGQHHGGLATLDRTLSGVALLQVDGPLGMLTTVSCAESVGELVCDELSFQEPVILRIVDGGIEVQDLYLRPMPSTVPLSLLTTPTVRSTVQAVEHCLGLFTAPYGPHGLELLHVSLSMQNGELVLHGLKVTGDPNVPAGELSFVITLHHLLDVNTALAADDRHVFHYIDGQPMVVDLLARRPRIVMWASGKGQINRNPAIWDPECVGCSWLRYDDAALVGGTSFTVLWDDGDKPYRHAMDFRKSSAQR